MRFKLILHTASNSLLPFNYQYPLSSAIYKIIQSADEAFAAFLHDTGYGYRGKTFKLFTFSDIKTPFQKQGDRMQLTTGEAELTICFYVPLAAENFIKGLFINQQLEVADKLSKTIFQIVQVESLAASPAKEEVVLHPLSPLVVGRKNDRGHYDYRSPEDADFEECLYYNWMEKCAAAGISESTLDSEVDIAVRFLPHPPQQRLITIKGGTDAETKIRGYTKFRLEVKAPKEMLEVALGAGMGLYNSQGMGCVGMVEKKEFIQGWTSTSQPLNQVF